MSKSSKNKKYTSTPRGEQQSANEVETLSTADNIRLVAGFVLMLIGAFILCSILSYFFYWKSDMSAIAEMDSPVGDPEFNNVCGSTGARVAAALVGGGFGLFALIVPFILVITGWRLFRCQPLRLHRFALILLLILVLGSLTIGYLFGCNWSVFGSGLGGEYGIALSNMLEGSIGSIGTLLVIVAGWILTGLLINRNFLQIVDNAGMQVAGGMTTATRRVWGFVYRRKESSDVESEADEYDEVNDDNEAEVATADDNEDDGMYVEPVEDGDDMVVVVDTQSSQLDEAVDNEADSRSVAAEESTTDDQSMAEDDSGEEESGEATAEGGDQASDDIFSVVPRDTELHDGTPLEPIDVARVLGVSPDDSGEGEDVNGDDEVDDEADEDGLIVTVTHNSSKQVDEASIESSLYDPMLDLSNYQPPMPSLLIDHKSKAVIDEQEIFQNKERIRETLLHFHIPIISMHATVGPTVTLYEIVQEPGVKISKIQGLENDLAQNLKAASVRIIAPIPGKGTVGIEVPNQTKQTVSMRSAICSEEFQSSKAELPVVIGRTIQNENYTFDLAKMPHLLVAGATGQGKSVGLNAIITSLLYRKHPAELKFVLIDPKMVEFSLYNKLERHFLAKMESEDESIVTDPKKAVYTLNALCTEMANRLELCKKAHAKNIVEYNEKFVARRLNPENGHRFLPYIVVIIDEFADLIMTAKEVEAPVMRLAQKARAIGIHLIVATQRPDVKVITGGIKANFPARIAFRVMQMTDSRTIIDQPGANQLIGRGDMLFLSGGEPIRIQCAFVDTPEVENIVEHIGAQQGYTSAYNLPDYTPEQGGGDGFVSFGSEESGAPQKFDPKFGEIAREAVANGIISTSMIQRNFEVGFNRAGRIMLQLERAGIVGPQIGSKPREIKYYDLPSLEARLQDLGVF